jgi:hypothetical protein
MCAVHTVWSELKNAASSKVTMRFSPVTFVSFQQLGDHVAIIVSSPH